MIVVGMISVKPPAPELENARKIAYNVAGVIFVNPHARMLEKARVVAIHMVGAGFALDAISL